MSFSDIRFAPVDIPAAPSTTTKAGITATSGTSTTALQIIPSAAGFGSPGLGEGWYDFVATGADAFVLFGDSGVAAATTNCMIIPQGIVTPYYIDGARAFVRVITAGVAGTLRWVPSGRR
jgi:hypothetical protein